MELMDAIRARKSYRNTFEPTPVPREDMREILEAGLSAPSGCNTQTTRFIGVDDPALAAKLGELMGLSWAKTAPAAVLLLTKEHICYKNFSYHVHDYSAAAENILLAITDKGYASTWIEGQIYGEIAKKMGALLGVPEEYTVAVYMPVGIPAKQANGTQKMPFEQRAWFNGFQK